MNNIIIMDAIRLNINKAGPLMPSVNINQSILWVRDVERSIRVDMTRDAIPVVMLKQSTACLPERSLNYGLFYCRLGVVDV
jgi:hypothetical protein